MRDSEYFEAKRFALQVLARAHAMNADKLERWHYWLGVPVVILTTIVGTTAFASLSDLGNTRVLIAVGTGALSVSAAVLAALQTFFAF
ncbi:SLATT domain-containing protein [Reyranella soli]|uniref:SMODS and SLOG-associating 2TM effector domain-containing protein n=1 Tax=Reyranella soli TaxID=1230389 RepID=A0A512NSM6_9HYPH|nr:SLATT domain-containing protein [Reyranella soli]GEP61953.1 hypothetical protein RSO01_91190 [Reyranella soli]